MMLSIIKTKIKQLTGRSVLEERIRGLELRTESQRKQLEITEKVFRDATDLSADLNSSSRGTSRIIVSGRFKGNDWVKVYEMQDQDFTATIGYLENMARYHKLSRIDASYPDKSFVSERLRSRGLME